MARIMPSQVASGRIGPARRSILFTEERLELGGQVVAARQHLIGLVGVRLQSPDVLGDLGIDVDGGFDVSLPLGGSIVEVGIAGLDPVTCSKRRSRERVAFGLGVSGT